MESESLRARRGTGTLARPGTAAKGSCASFRLLQLPSSEHLTLFWTFRSIRKSLQEPGWEQLGRPGEGTTAIGCGTIDNLWIHIGIMSCLSWQWHRTGYRWSPVRIVTRNLPVYSSSCHCKCITKKIENEVHTSRTNMQQCAPPQGSTLLIVPQCLAAARGRGFDSDGCDALPVAAILQWHPLWPRLWRMVFTQHWTKIRTTCSPCRSCTCTDTFRTTGH